MTQLNLISAQEPQAGAIEFRDWHHVPWSERSVRGVVGKISVHAAKDIAGIEVNDRDSNWLIRVEGPSGMAYYALGCQIACVTYFPEGYTGAASPEFCAVPQAMDLVDEDPQVWQLDCGFADGPHEFPIDWQWGGANDADPRADPRWMPTTYQYYDEKLKSIHVTQTPLCDEEAIDEFTKVASFGPSFAPVWIAVKRHGDAKFTMLPVKYNKATDTAEDLPNA